LLDLEETRFKIPPTLRASHSVLIDQHEKVVENLAAYLYGSSFFLLTK